MMINKTGATDELIKTRDRKTADNCDIQYLRGLFHLCYMWMYWQ